MKILIKDLAHDYKLNPDQLVAFAREHRNKYNVFDDEESNDPVNNAKTDTWSADKLVQDFKHANRKGHDWRENLPQNENKINNMKAKLINEERYAYDVIQLEAKFKMACRTYVTALLKNDYDPVDIVEELNDIIEEIVDEASE